MNECTFRFELCRCPFYFPCWKCIQKAGHQIKVHSYYHHLWVWKVCVIISEWSGLSRLYCTLLMMLIQSSLLFVKKDGRVMYTVEIFTHFVLISNVASIFFLTKWNSVFKWLVSAHIFKIPSDLNPFSFGLSSDLNSFRFGFLQIWIPPDLNPFRHESLQNCFFFIFKPHQICILS